MPIKILLRVSAILWIIWGLVHVMAGVLTISNDIQTAAAGIADAVDPSVFVMDYPQALEAIINQHGWNLLWGGVVTTIAAFYIWRASATAVYIAAMVGGLLDVGYFVFMDLGGYVNFVPGTIMTIISASAIILSVTALQMQKKVE